MKGYAAQGLSYPAARQRFLQEKTGWSEKKCRERMQPGNILGAEYRQAIRLLGSSMRCEPILREGMGYHQVTPEKRKRLEIYVSHCDPCAAGKRI